MLNISNKLKVVVFISGASVMMLEMVGSRILAPYVGTSIFIWTSLIGIILASLSFGYWIGGVLADKYPDINKLSLILAGAALLVGFTATFSDSFLTLITRAHIDIRMQVFIASIILFTPASILLGTISPYAAKLCLKDIKGSGKMIGTLYALSNIGSIIGTFLAGFYLISFMGSTNLLYVISAILIITSFFLNALNELKTKAITGAILIYLVSTHKILANYIFEQEIIDRDTQYNRVWIYDTKDIDGRQIKLMNINDEYSSAMYLDSEDLVFEYTKLYQLAEVFNPDFKHTLLIGGAGYSYPKFYLSTYPEAFMDVVEIDPGITELAKTHFNLKPNPKLSIYHQDGRVYLNNTSQTYDVILGDAFKSQTVPFQLTTVESVSQMHKILNNDGVVLINLIGSITGDNGRFVRASYRTYSKIFPQVYLFPIGLGGNPNQIQNIMLVAFKSTQEINWKTNNPQLQQYLSLRYEQPIPDDVKIFTDDLAPVEYYTSNMF